VDSLETDFERIANKRYAWLDKPAETRLANWLWPHIVDLGSAESPQYSTEFNPSPAELNPSPAEFNPSSAELNPSPAEFNPSSAKFNREAAIDRTHRRRRNVPRGECRHDEVLGKRGLDFSVDHDAL
jgi:hypothetical protein